MQSTTFVESLKSMSELQVCASAIKKAKCLSIRTQTRRRSDAMSHCLLAADDGMRTDELAFREPKWLYSRMGLITCFG